MTRTVRRSKQPSGLRATWPALAVLACLVAEVAGFIVLHQSMQEYRAPAAGVSSIYR